MQNLRKIFKAIRMICQFLWYVLKTNVVLRSIAFEECRKLRIKCPKVIIGRIAESGLAGYARGFNLIVVDARYPMAELINTTRHELRHIWQATYYRDFYLWCATRREYKNKKLDEERFYGLCPIELDARYYAKLHGKSMRGPIDEFTLDELKEMYANGTFYRVMYDLAVRYGKP